MYTYVFNFSTYLSPMAWITLSGILLTLGDILLRQALHLHGTNWLVTAIGVYIVGLMCMIMSFFHQHIAIATVATVILNMVAYMLYAWWMFGDTITLKQALGLTAGILAIILLELP